MPAPIISARPSPRAASHKARGQPQPRKTRIVRRRGRVNGGVGSDDEIEREVGTDSESEQSSLDTESDSDTEPASEDVPSNTLTRSTTQSPDDIASINPRVSEKPAAEPILNGGTPFFSSATGNWSEMVADEKANGPADLPVIDFRDLTSRTVEQYPSSSSRPRKTQKVAKKVPTAPASDRAPPSASAKDEPIPTADADTEDHDASNAPTSHPFDARQPPGRNARQAYQQRLESDPSYVPTVGEFWGHDDRLMDKDLRSLSGWWRGRWQGRGRGGFDRGMSMRGRGRGRGGFFGAPTRSPNSDAEMPHESEQDIPPVEKPWTHDGFEEMWRRDEKRPTPTQANRGSFGGFRGGFVPRGRGNMRGGFSPRGRPNLPFAPPAGRPWFSMKPERVWTKQFDGFLHADIASKPRIGQAPAFRIHLPGGSPHVVRASRSRMPSASTLASSTSAVVPDDTYIVKLPKRAGKERVVEPPAEEETVVPVTKSPAEDVFTVRPQLQDRSMVRDPSTSSIPPPAPAPEASQSQDAGDHAPSVASPHPQQEPEQFFEEQEQVDQIRRAQSDDAAFQHQESQSNYSGGQSGEPHAQAPPLPPIQTSFTPIPQASPPYGSPYGYATSLPPGIGMGQNGVAYELATGRPVYLQPPPPLPMYNPQPIMHTHMPPPGIPFVPGHMRHPSSMSPDFVAPHTPPVNGFIDPSTGAPIFVLPRQSSRVEIRAPTEPSNGKSFSKAERRQSGLRTSAVAFEPSQSVESQPEEGYYPAHSGMLMDGTSYGDVDGAPVHDGNDVHSYPQPLESAGMVYSPYQQQQYYYPDAYGYPGYMDAQAHYDPYASDRHTPQSAIYY